MAYDGGRFHGWARQPGLRTVQGELESALCKVLHVHMDGQATPTTAAVAAETLKPVPFPGRFPSEEEVEGPSQVAATSAYASCEAERASQAVPFSAEQGLKLVVAGRTDTGVHASHQVCHLDVSEAALLRCVGHMDVSDTEALFCRLRRILPNDIVLLSVSRAPDGFDARFSALERTYVYRVSDGGRQPDPRLRGFVLAVDGVLDIDLMNEAAKSMIGLHDFGSFATPNPGGTTIREVKYAQWQRLGYHPLVEGLERSEHCAGPGYVVPTVESGLVVFTIVADAFAHNMVRSLVNACVRVGQGKQTVSWFKGKMEEPVREGSTGPIAACGLTLEGVSYPDDTQLSARAEAIRAKRTL